MTEMTLPHRLTLVKFLTESLAKGRKDVLLPQSEKEMPSGSRIPAMFGTRRAAWVSMPQPAQKRAYIREPAKLLAWAKTNYPDKVEPTTEVVVTPALIAHLKEHFPSALKAGEEVDPQWVSDICGALKDPGHYLTIQGEKLTEVPGIVLPEPDPPVPHVDLADDAEEIIREAWAAGDIPVADLLALPAGGEA